MDILSQSEIDETLKHLINSQEDDLPTYDSYSIFILNEKLKWFEAKKREYLTKIETECDPFIENLTKAIDILEYSGFDKREEC